MQNTWLQVTVKANAHTGLERPDIFNFGNLIGDTGNSDAPFRVNAIDLAAVKLGLNKRFPLGGRIDFNRDGVANALDLGIAKSKLNRTLGAMAAVLPAAPAGSSGAPTPARLWDEARSDLLA